MCESGVRGPEDALSAPTTKGGEARYEGIHNHGNVEKDNHDNDNQDNQDRRRGRLSHSDRSINRKEGGLKGLPSFSFTNILYIAVCALILCGLGWLYIVFINIIMEAKYGS